MTQLEHELVNVVVDGVSCACSVDPCRPTGTVRFFANTTEIIVHCDSSSRSHFRYGSIPTIDHDIVIRQIVSRERSVIADAAIWGVEDLLAVFEDGEATQRHGDEVRRNGVAICTIAKRAIEEAYRLAHQFARLQALTLEHLSGLPNYDES